MLNTLNPLNMEEKWKTFEDLDTYKKSCKFRNKIYELVKKLPSHEKYNLNLQMRRAATSLTNNIAEGHGRYSYKDTVHFIIQTRGSLQELIDDLNICRDQEYIEENKINELKSEAYILLKLINGYIAYLRNKEDS